MSANKIILRNRHGTEVAAIFLDEDSHRWRIISKVNHNSSAISLLKKKRSMCGMRISTPGQENFANNEILLRRQIPHAPHWLDIFRARRLNI